MAISLTRARGRAEYPLVIGIGPVATAAEKKDIVKKRLQELRNMCRDHYAVVAEESTMPDPADVRATNAKLQELMDLLDGKKKWDDA